MKRKIVFTPCWLCCICFLLLSLQQTYAQSITVRGQVTENNRPLAGVTVKNIGSTVQAQTDTQGKYTISAATVTALEFTFLGYAKQRFEFSQLKQISQGNYELNVQLDASEGDVLDEVVVVGFGSQKKTNLTGSVAVVDAKQLENRPVRNAIQALQGLAPGLNISQNSGTMETNPSINIRGTGTIGTSSSAPLILIDGSEGSLAALNPQDIESVSVLKDAGAASIYGSRAAFGVILVTTKSGKAGRTSVNYNNSFRMNAPTLMPKMMDSYTFAQYFNQAEVNAGGSPHFSAEHLQRILDYQNGSLKNSTIVDPNNKLYWAEGYAYGNDNNDWFDVMYRDQAFAQEHNLSLNGGTEKTTYYLSGNIMKQQGLMAFNTDHYDRYAVAAKINSKVSDIFQVNYNARLVREDYDRPAALTNSFYDDLGRQGWPTLPLYDPNGYLFSSPSPALAMKEGGQDKSSKDYIYQQLQLILEPIKGWRTTGNFNYRTTTQFRHWDSQRLYNHDVNGDPYLYKNSSNVYEFGLKENYYNINIFSDYDKSWGDHHVKVMVGGQIEHTAYRNLGVQRDGIIIPDQPVLNLTSGTDINGKAVVPSVSGEYQKWATAGFFGRLNYNYAEKYLLEANLRYDGSSRHLASLPNGGQNALGTQWGAGDIMYADLNGDGKIDGGSNTEADPGDRRVIGNSTPRYSFGLNLNADYRNFDFSIFMQGVMKRDYWQGGYYFWGATSKWWSTGLVDHLDYFRTADNPLGENLEAYYARPVFGTAKNQQTQTRFLQNAAYIRIKNIQLGYTLPKETTKRFGVERLRVYVSGENIWTGSSVAGMFDPETIDGGSNGTVYPLTKVWSAGLSVTF